MNNPLENTYHPLQQMIAEKMQQCGRKLEEIEWIAISKNRSVPLIESAYDLGIRQFGESRPQELLKKVNACSADYLWHFIGHLQKNKIATLLPVCHLIHSVDTFELAQKISEISQKQGRTTSILLQVNTSAESTKQGLIPEKWESLLDKINALPNLTIKGLMTMAPLTSDEFLIHRAFADLYHLKEKWQSKMRDPLAFRHLSMGMSNDFLIAIEEGATLLRIGSALFEKND